MTAQPPNIDPTSSLVDEALELVNVFHPRLLTAQRASRLPAMETAAHAGTGRQLKGPVAAPLAIGEVPTLDEHELGRLLEAADALEQRALCRDRLRCNVVRCLGSLGLQLRVP